MDPTIAVLLYKLASLAAGVAMVWMGYRLFAQGWFEKAGDLKAAWGDKNLTIKQAAPGTFFAIFGAVVVGLTVWRGFSFTAALPSVSTPQPTAAAVDSPPAESLATRQGKETEWPTLSVLGGYLERTEGGPERSALEEVETILRGPSEVEAAGEK